MEFNFFDTTFIKIFETGIVIVVYLLLKQLLMRAITRHSTKKSFNKTRDIIVRKSMTTILTTLSLVIILIIWGVDQTELAVFIGSALTVVGIALFAQWSILSNITSGIILFFNNSLSMDETIVILDKDYQIEGRVKDIGLFFVIIETIDKEEVSIPSNVFIQKMVKRKGR